MRLYNPPAALLPKGDKFSVELAGAKTILALTEEKDFINIASVFDELSLGEFWKDNPAIADQIEKINIKYEDSDALYDPKILAERIISTIDRIRTRGLILFGTASFEGNAFESSVFDELELSFEDQDRLLNLYKKSRIKGAFPNVKKGISGLNEYVEINWFGDASKFFTLTDKKDLNEIAAMTYPYEGTVTGIVAVAQGAANFIILTDTIFKKTDSAQIHIDKRNLNQMFKLLNKGILSAPISWFKIDLGYKGLQSLEGWDEIKDLPEVKKAIASYRDYHRSLIIQKEKKTIEKILDEDLGNPIDFSKLTEEEIEDDLEQIMATLNRLNELQMSSVEESFLYDPPKILFSQASSNLAPIGGAMSLLSIDVGQNISCVASLRENVSWGEFLCDDESQELDEETFFDIREDQDFFELENPIQLRDIYTKTFQNIMRGSELFLGLLELEANSFEFSLFQELPLEETILKKLQESYHLKIRQGKYPQLKDRHIKIIWKGKGKQVFTFPNCFPSILDIAQTIFYDKKYHDKYFTGIVCVDENSTYFYTLTNNIKEENKKVDQTTLKQLFEDLNKSEIALLCWFKINLGLSSLKNHPYWKGAMNYDSLQYVLENYKKYMKTLIEQKKKEDQYRIY
ncbi:MAG: hypothetical protein K9W44_18150 [Candidatus Lokiarchaeota archaeon]|nr:hypothetical protein [Candidatus Harpocratesius repetitus]